MKKSEYIKRTYADKPIVGMWEGKYYVAVANQIFFNLKFYILNHD